MEHPRLMHPEFGLLCPRPRFRREVRIAAISLLLGGLAGAVCVSAVMGVQHRDTPASGSSASSRPSALLESAPAASRDANDAAVASRSVASTTKGETAAPAAPPASFQAPKTRVIRLRGPGETPTIARLPLGRTAPVLHSPPSAEAPIPPQAPASLPAADNSVAEMSQTAAAQPDGSAKTRPANVSQKKARSAARAPSRRRTEPANQPGDGLRDEPRNDYAWWRDRPDRGSGRGSVPDEDRGMVGRAYARDGAYPVRGFWEWSR
jgi:hypothetical protein